MTSDDPQFFMTDDNEVEGPARELVGYGEHPPQVQWDGGAKVAVQIVVNYEEGSEKTFAMGDGVNDILYELPFALEGQRDLAVESMYEYGSRAGIWRMFRVFDAAEIPVTFFGAAVALERNPEVAKKLAARGDETAGHGYRWSNHFEMTRDDEREAIKRAVESIKRTTGTRPVGWYCREMSVNTRELVVEEGASSTTPTPTTTTFPTGRASSASRTSWCRTGSWSTTRATSSAPGSGAPSISSRPRRRTSTGCAATATTSRG